MPYYAVARGNPPGIYTMWTACHGAVTNFPNAKYKKFKTLREAIDFLEENSPTETEILAEAGTPLPPDYYVYTDGACSNNGRPNAKAGLGVYFGQDDPRNISEVLHKDQKQTNNTAEVMALIRAYDVIRSDLIAGKRITIVSDSEYAINCATIYGAKCAKSNWRKDMPNKLLVKQAYENYRPHVSTSHVEFMHIAAHTSNTDVHSAGNDGADKLANQAIGLESCPYQNQTKQTAQSRVYLKVVYKDKDMIKSLGGRWDPDKKMWYVFDNNENLEQVMAAFKRSS